MSSIAQIKAQVTTDVPEDFEPFLANGDPSGCFLKVLSDQCASVREGMSAIANRQRRRDQINSAKAAKSRPGEVFTPIETDIEDGLEMTALRLAGWRGEGDTKGLTPEQVKRFDPITDEFSLANAIELFRAAPAWMSQVTTKSAEMAGFTKTSA